MDGNLGGARRRLAESVAQAADRLPDPRRGGPLVLCLSGGTDSSALALAVSDLRSLRPDLFAAGIRAVHVRHKLRGSESEGDAESVRELCGRLGLALRVVDAAVDPGPGLESRARQARYVALRDAEPVALLATAHHGGDQAETVVLRLLRGAGPRGLSAIRPLREDGIWRPLLEASRQDLVRTCRESEWLAREDSSNADLKYARNRLRHEFLPAWEREERGVLSALASLARSAQDLEPFLDRALDRLADQVSLELRDHGFQLDLSDWPPDREPPQADPELDLLLERTWTRLGRRPWSTEHKARLVADACAGRSGRRSGGQDESAVFGGGRLRVEPPLKPHGADS
jgi:tRNA(Ile)-lysidine synthase